MPIPMFPPLGVDTFTANSTSGVTRGGRNDPMKHFTVTVLRTAGSTDTVSIQLQISSDGATWLTAGTVVTDVTNGGGFGVVFDQPASFWRARCTTVGSGNTLTVDIVAVG
jgi:hypothetical protein